MHQQIQALSDALRNAVDGLAPEQMDAHPLEGKWSMAEVLEHLSLTYSGTAKGLQRVLGSGKPAVTSRSPKQMLFQAVTLGLGYLPEGRKAPKGVVPSGGKPSAELAANIFTLLQQMDNGLDECEKRFGSGKKIMDHPVMGACSVRQWRKFHLVHGMHHVKQLERLRGMLQQGRAAGA
jgi:hypothetical protein